MSTRIVEELREIAQAEVLLVALDFDGTVSHLSDEPMAVRAVPEAIAAVDALLDLERTYVAYVSGRSMRDLKVITERPDVSPLILVGSHGAEWLMPAVLGQVPDTADDEGKRAAAQHVQERVAAALEDLEGVFVEDKAFGFAVHTRLADDDATVLAHQRTAEIMAEAASDWRTRTGKDVLELAWRHEGKDDAIARLRQLTGATAVLFAGDDVTDEDALRSLGDSDLGVHVGNRDTAATLSVNTPEELSALLNVIASMRAAAVPASDAA